MTINPNLKVQVNNWFQDFPALQTLFHVFTDAGYPPRFVGGVVRDALRGVIFHTEGDFHKTPDFDIAVPCPPDRTIKILADNGIQCVPIGLAYGCVMVVLHGQSFEITSLRADVATDGRRATVAYTTDWALDAERRDLTINALSCDGDGFVYDYVGGVSDLKNGIVRFVGNADIRVQEDILRILRYYRFLAVFTTPNRLHNPPPHMHQAWHACCTHAPKINTLSGERIWAELGKILAGQPHGLFYDTLDLMAIHGVLDVVLPGHIWDKQVYSDLCNALEKITPLNHISETLPVSHNTVMILARFCGLFAGKGFVQKGQIPRITLKKLRLSNDEKKTIDILSTPLNPPENLLDKGLFYESLCTCGKTLTHGRLVLSGVKNTDQIMARFRGFLPQKFPLTGQNVLDLGIASGRVVGDALCHGKTLWYQSGCTRHKQSLLHAIKGHFGV